MIYTIGNDKIYRELIACSPTVKIGKRDDYEGGCCFRTVEDAQKMIDKFYPDEDYGVFGLMADWENDTYQNGNNLWRSLLYDRQICLLPELDFV